MTSFRGSLLRQMLLTGTTAAVVAFGAAAAAAQERGSDRIVPTNAVLISGYGTVGYAYQPEDDHEGDEHTAVPSAFSSSVSPIFLFQFMDRVLFEAELEFELEDGATETALEYAQADIFLNDNLTLVAGKFLVPFGVFGERIHPSWINKLATMPPIYGHHGSAFGAEPLSAILSDVGVMMRATLPAGPFMLGASAYVTNGFAAEEHAEEGDEHGGEEAGEEGHEEAEIPEIGIPGSSADVTNSKLVGGRLDIALPPIMEVNISAFDGKYDDHDELAMTGINVAGELRYAGFEARGEYLRTKQDFEGHEGVEQLTRSGYYVQLSRRIGAWEPVVRFSRIFDDEVGHEVEETAASQTAIGLDYWIAPSVAVMASYEFNREDAFTVDNDRFNLHLAFGF